MTWNPAHFPRVRGAVHVEITGRRARLVLDNPNAKNAMSVGMMADLIAAVEQLEQSNVLVVLIHGAGTSGFCAGGDLRDVRSHLLTPHTRSMARGLPHIVQPTLTR